MAAVRALAAAIGALTAVSATAPTFCDTMIALHASVRRSAHAQPLTWDEGLARDAGVWADRLAARGTLEHDPRNDDEGENLWLGTRGAYSLDEMVQGWSDEKADLARMRSWEDDYEQVGHYTQMIWSRTRKLGCALRTGREYDVLVCRYWPAGNVIGEQP